MAYKVTMTRVPSGQVVRTTYFEERWEASKYAKASTMMNTRTVITGVKASTWGLFNVTDNALVGTGCTLAAVKKAVRDWPNLKLEIVPEP